MNLKLQYKNLVLVILALLVCFCFNVYAQSSTTIGNDIVVVTIRDERGNTVSLYLPESMNNDQCGRRIYGTRTGVIGMFKTLYSEERRTESYEAAIRELCMQPGASQSDIGHLEKSLQSAGIASEDANLVLNLVKYGADSINKKYIKSGTLTADVHNRIAKVGRDLNAAQKSPAFAQACIAFENVNATAKLTETITGAFLLNSLSTDQAWTRLKEIERAVDSERKAQGKVDPALEEAIEQSEINLLAAQSKIGAFAVSVNDNLQEITDSAIGLGATLAEMSFKFSAPVAMWVGAPLMTYNTLRGVSDQWEMAQDGVSLATVTKMVERHSQGREGITDNITSYGQYAFYSQMEETFSVGGAKLHDLLSPGSANKDWSQYYKQGKQNTTIIAMKNSNSQFDVYVQISTPSLITPTRIAFLSDRDGKLEIYIMKADGSNQTRLTNNSGWYNIDPCFSPDGQNIAFSSDRDGNTQIYIMKADGSNQTRLTNNSGKDENPCFSPDGQKIAFSSDRDGKWEIYIMKADGSNQTRLTNNSGKDENPCFSPDGQKIAFSSNRDGKWEIYIMKADGSNQTRLTNNSSWDLFPSWGSIDI